MKKMTKIQWKGLHSILKQIYLDFQKAYYEYNHGRNKRIREAAYKKVKNEITLAKIHIEDNYEAFILLTGGEKISDYQRAINYNEFSKPNYFDSDMSILLNKIEEILKED